MNTIPETQRARRGAYDPHTLRAFIAPPEDPAPDLDAINRRLAEAVVLDAPLHRAGGIDRPQPIRR